MPLVRRELTEEEEQGLQDSILGAIPVGRSRAVRGSSVLRSVKPVLRESKIPQARFWEQLGRLKDKGLLVSRTRVGWWRPRTEAESEGEEAEEEARELLPKKRARERDYYNPIAVWMERFYDCYTEKVSERGKRGKDRTLIAVPDVVGVRYVPGPNKDAVEVMAVEVKIGRPNTHHLSEAYRYSRFADFCYLAYDDETLKDTNAKRTLVAECARLGLGLIEFPRVSRQGKRFHELRAATRQQPDPIARDEYLARVLKLWQCIRCGAYKFRDEGELVSYERSSELLGAFSSGKDWKTASRFKCKACMVA